MTFLEHFNELHPHIKDYVYFGWAIRKDMGNGDIIGWNCNSSSVVRKSSCLERVEKEIERLNLPLKVVDELDKTRLFQILNK